MPDTIDGNLSFVNKDGLLKSFKTILRKNQLISLHSNTYLIAI